MRETKAYSLPTMGEPLLDHSVEGVIQENDRETLRHYVRRLKEGRVGVLIRTLLSSPETAGRFTKIHKDKDVFLSSEVERSSEKVSSVLVSIMRDPQLRGFLVDAMLHDFEDHSDTLLREIAEQRKRVETSGVYDEQAEAALVYDEVIVGGGVHASVYNIRRTRSNPSIKSLTIEASDAISSNFRTKGFVRINSANSPHEPGTPNHLLKKGNLNFFGKHAPIQLPFIEQERFPSASSIADVATANQFLSNSDILMRTRVARVVKSGDDPTSTEEQWPARYKIFFEDGQYVFSHRVIMATGLGECRLPPDFDDQTIKIVEKYIESQDARVPPAIMTYDQFAEFTTKSDTPFRTFAHKKIDVCGAGDSAATTIEFLLRMSKKEAYHQDVAQVGDIQRIHWVGQKGMTSDEYYEALRNDRYAGIAVEMPAPDRKTRKGEREKKILPVPGHLVQIRESDQREQGRFRVLYRMQDGSTKEGYTDFVVLATGYTDRLSAILGFKENPFEDKKVAEVVKGNFPDIQVRMPIAVKLKGEEIYGMGPAAIGDVLVESELEAAGLLRIERPANPRVIVTIATFGPRTEKLAEHFSEKTPEKRLGRFIPVVEQTEILPSNQEKSTKYPLAYSDSQPLADVFTEVQLRTALGEVFQWMICGDKNTPHDIHVVFCREKDGTLHVSFSPNIDSGAAKTVVEALERHGVSNYVFQIIGRGRWCRIDATIPFTKNGRVRVPDINVQKLLQDKEPAG
ncbi:hypothetical protein HY629_02560 [Candidatus Uhrbacteria bacterium]|nr:hypothetical protein [Candidatus Uhrbacteria bacterium]